MSGNSQSDPQPNTSMDLPKPSISLAAEKRPAHPPTAEPSRALKRNKLPSSPNGATSTSSSSAPLWMEILDNWSGSAGGDEAYLAEPEKTIRDLMPQTQEGKVLAREFLMAILDDCDISPQANQGSNQVELDTGLTLALLRTNVKAANRREKDANQREKDANQREKDALWKFEVKVAAFDLLSKSFDSIGQVARNFENESLARQQEVDRLQEELAALRAAHEAVCTRHARTRESLQDLSTRVVQHVDRMSAAARELNEVVAQAQECLGAPVKREA